MATELEKLVALNEAGMTSDEDKARLAELQGQAQAKLEPPAPAAKSAAAAKAPASTTVNFEDIVDIAKFNEGGEQYFMPSESGYWKSELVAVDKPSFGSNADKDLKIFNFVTNDTRLKAQGRAAVWCEMGKGAFQLKTILDGIGIPYTVEGSVVKYSITFPHACYADWSRDPKGKASGGVLLTGLRTVEAGASIEKAI